MESRAKLSVEAEGAEPGKGARRDEFDAPTASAQTPPDWQSSTHGERSDEGAEGQAGRLGMFSSRPQGAQAKIEDKLRHNLRQKDSDSDCKSLRCTPGCSRSLGPRLPPCGEGAGPRGLSGLGTESCGNVTDDEALAKMIYYTVTRYSYWSCTICTCAYLFFVAQA